MACARSVLWLVLALGAAVRAGDAPADRPIDVKVDVHDAWSGLSRATVEIPVTPGPLRLCYRRWDWSAHAESNGIGRISELSMSAGAQPVEWRRADKDPWSFLCTVPDGADTLTVTLAVATDFEDGEWNPESTSTGSLAVVPWGDLLLYPAGKDVRDLRARASLRIPDGWGLATSLKEANRAEDGTARFEEVSLAELVDSPVAIGRSVRKIPLPVAEGGGSNVLAVIGERDIELPEDFPLCLARAIDEAQLVLGPPPTDRYTFLMVADEFLETGGREHLRSSVDLVTAGDLEDDRPWIAETLVHEYVHAWNGRRHLPAGMRVHDFQERPDFRLIWVYEGLTNYLGYVLAARSGFWDDSTFKWALAGDASTARLQAPGGGWRSLEDVCETAPVHAREVPWKDRRREHAQYGEATLLWLEIDCLLRKRTGGKKSLDDFCRRFFGRAADGEVAIYGMEDIVATLASLVDLDWSRFLRERVCATHQDAAAGLRASGWELGNGSLTPQMALLRGAEYRHNGRTCASFSFSIGAVVASDGTILDVTPGGPVEAAGIGPGGRIASVNGASFSIKSLMEGVYGTTSTPLRLTVVRGDRTKGVQLDYKGGYREPVLVRTDGPDLLAQIVLGGD